MVVEVEASKRGVDGFWECYGCQRPGSANESVLVSWLVGGC